MGRHGAGRGVAARALEGFESEAEAKRNVVVAIDRVARRLGNTRAVSRRSYVHPAVIDSYLDHKLAEALTRRTDRRQERAAATPSVEAAVLKLIGRRRS